MPRATMASLIARVRLMVAESGTAIFSDDNIQDKLDECRFDVRYALLVPKPTYSNSLGIQYNDYYYIPSGEPSGKVVGMLAGEHSRKTPERALRHSRRDVRNCVNRLRTPCDDPQTRRPLPNGRIQRAQRL